MMYKSKKFSATSEVFLPLLRKVKGSGYYEDNGKLMKMVNGIEVGEVKLDDIQYIEYEEVRKEDDSQNR